MLDIILAECLLRPRELPTARQVDDRQQTTQLRCSLQAGIDMDFYIALVIINVFVCQELACE